MQVQFNPRHLEFIVVFFSESRHNDIAILLLSSSNSLPHWAQVACLPTSPPQFDTSCVAISNDDKYVCESFYLYMILIKQSININQSIFNHLNS